MLNKIEILNLLKENKTQIEALGATKIGLFGSYTKDLATDDSDVDILIELASDGDIYGNYCNIKYFLEDLFQKKVDVLTTGHFRKNYKTEIAKKHSELIQKEIAESIIYI
ncbi:nucleotidyltransferase family protein [Candidatus Cetobacterium colombiensis]|uniref:Nucleotidyltransferase domain-containing protein n=1 Tax=Candidatus Cetobacterium colombiensis TaxID=3073100 RepID=A0ABU4WG57_9FUSO|nr:nucleotidyltransferase domain-containing protein [Candidatus Cetobacterium colombiensis]MDX8337360.1 nucleotidyltransferase domain-containing protein [Candidatus Cetobacterium colombiensis]